MKSMKEMHRVLPAGLQMHLLDVSADRRGAHLVLQELQVSAADRPQSLAADSRAGPQR